MIVTVAERRAREVESLRRAGAAALADIGAYALAEGVRFTLFGSFARGDVASGSDLDLVVEGPAERQRPARAAAEAIIERHGLRADVLLAEEVGDGLRLRLERDGIALP